MCQKENAPKYECLTVREKRFGASTPLKWRESSDEGYPSESLKGKGGNAECSAARG